MYNLRGTLCTQYKQKGSLKVWKISDHDKECYHSAVLLIPIELWSQRRENWSFLVSPSMPLYNVYATDIETFKTCSPCLHSLVKTSVTFVRILKQVKTLDCISGFHWSALEFSQKFASVFNRLWRYGKDVLFIK